MSMVLNHNHRAIAKQVRDERWQENNLISMCSHYLR